MVFWKYILSLVVVLQDKKFFILSYVLERLSLAVGILLYPQENIHCYRMANSI